jgi:hypothetical protein
VARFEAKESEEGAKELTYGKAEDPREMGGEVNGFSVPRRHHEQAGRRHSTCVVGGIRQVRYKRENNYVTMEPSREPRGIYVPFPFDVISSDGGGRWEAELQGALPAGSKLLLSAKKEKKGRMAEKMNSGEK